MALGIFEEEERHMSSPNVAPPSELCTRDQLFVMPPMGYRLRAPVSRGFKALATTSEGMAWSLGKLDQNVSRSELIAHVASLAAATSLPLSVDSERCFPDDPGGVAETVALLAEAGAAGFSVEDWNPESGAIDDVAFAAERVAIAAEAAHGLAEPMVVTGRAENHVHGVDDIDDTIARLIAYRDAGADAVYAPGLRELDKIAAIVEAVGLPVNALAQTGRPSGARLGGGRVSTGSLRLLPHTERWWPERASWRRKDVSVPRPACRANCSEKHWHDA
jgi:2-methylisocitrate lyase-like PEP mutase family enzyme